MTLIILIFACFAKRLGALHDGDLLSRIGMDLWKKVVSKGNKRVLEDVSDHLTCCFGRSNV